MASWAEMENSLLSGLSLQSAFPSWSRLGTVYRSGNRWDSEAAAFFCEGPDSKHLGLCGPEFLCFVAVREAVTDSVSVSKQALWIPKLDFMSFRMSQNAVLSLTFTPATVLSSYTSCTKTGGWQAGFGPSGLTTLLGGAAWW